MKFGWSDGGNELTGENLIIRRKTKPTWTDLGPNPRSTINDLNHGVANRTVVLLLLQSTTATLAYATAHKVLVASENCQF